ncbi:lantibiotic modifying enzyme [Streptococcus pneumoniae]|nr:lantibiotic modifying enzyme [Streptococcus pneumoniae]
MSTKSQTNNLVKIKKIEEHKYDYKTECNSVLRFLLDKTVNSEGRITSSTEFGNFVSNLSFQHGIAGLLFPLNKLYHPELDSKILSIIKKAVTIRTSHTYEYQYSLLFGGAGYL